MLLGDGLVAGPAGAEIMAGDDAGILEQLDRAVDGGDGNLRVHLRGAAAESLDIGIVGGRRQYARDGAALFGHAMPLATQSSSRFSLSSLTVGCFRTLSPSSR